MALTSVNYGIHDISGAELLAAIDSVPAFTDSGLSGAALHLVPVGGGKVCVIGVDVA